MSDYAELLQARLDAATESLAFETRSPALWKTIERLATVVMNGEKAAGRVRGFAVRCDESINPPGTEEFVVEVSYVPPAPRAKGLTVRLRAR